VPPAELEAILCSHPSVADAGVIGIPDVDGGEVPRAYVSLKHGATATPDELKQFVAGACEVMYVTLYRFRYVCDSGGFHIFYVVGVVGTNLRRYLW